MPRIRKARLRLILKAPLYGKEIAACLCPSPLWGEDWGEGKAYSEKNETSKIESIYRAFDFHSFCFIFKYCGSGRDRLNPGDGRLRKAKTLQLLSIFSCNAANISANGTINALDIGVDTLEVGSFPFPFSLILIMRFEYFSTEAGPHEALIKLIDGDGASKFEKNVRFNMEADRKFHQLVVSFPHLEVEAPGNYRFDVLVDNVFKGYWPLDVEARPEEQNFR